MLSVDPSLYDTEFYDDHHDDSLRSARVTVPLVLSLVAPRSVVDVGCGTGTWLRAFIENGIENVVGIDGDYVPRDRLMIPVDRFIASDLTKPLRQDRTFDLAVSLEVAEHLPASAADDFVRSLCSLAPVILFSAAVPGQWGVRHLNPQWPWYWHKKFEANGFLVLDAVRPRLWLDQRVAGWYRQNMYLMVRAEAVQKIVGLKDVPTVAKGEPLLLITGPVLVANLRLRESLKRIPGLIYEALVAGFGRRRRRWPWED
jgi:SAM-dependent methyltransferase